MNKEIITYIEFIKKFEGKLNSKFEISGNIWERSGKDFPKSGKVGDYKYSFHGAGCRIENNGIICEYDIAPLNGKSIKFSLWKLANFIKIHPKLEEKEFSDLDKELSFLVKERFLSKLKIDDIETSTYQVELC
tara:strand:- start:13 stop:411 length:399 start_codon:yes stop_codon:yes gene_type:complete